MLSRADAAVSRQARRSTAVPRTQRARGKLAAFYPYAASNVDDSRTIVRPAFLPVSRTTTVTFFSGRPLLLAGHEGLAADPVGLAPGQVHAT